MADAERVGIFAKLASPEMKERVEYTATALGAASALAAAGAIVSGAAIPVIATAAAISAASLIGTKLAQPVFNVIDKLSQLKTKEPVSLQAEEKPLTGKQTEKTNELDLDKLQKSALEKDSEKAKSSEFVVRVGAEEISCSSQREAIQTFLEQSAEKPDAKIEVVRRGTPEVIATKEPATVPKFANSEAKFLAEQALERNPELLNKLIRSFDTSKDFVAGLQRSQFAKDAEKTMKEAVDFYKLATGAGLVTKTVSVAMDAWKHAQAKANQHDKGQEKSATKPAKEQKGMGL